jgi:cystathionine beta-lyase
MGEICEKHGCIIVSDEIHCDFAYPGHKHSVLPTISPWLAENTILCTAPSKTFNIAGLQTANIIIQNPELRKKFKREIYKSGYSQLNLVGLAACQSAYEHGGEWLAELKEYLSGNLSFVRDLIKERTPQIKLIEPDGTYLIWLDFRGSGINPEELDSFIANKAGLWLDGGDIFGREGLGFQRINIACPRKTLEEALLRLEEALRPWGSAPHPA